MITSLNQFRLYNGFLLNRDEFSEAFLSYLFQVYWVSRNVVVQKCVWSLLGLKPIIIRQDKTTSENPGFQRLSANGILSHFPHAFLSFSGHCGSFSVCHAHTYPWESTVDRFKPAVLGLGDSANGSSIFFITCSGKKRSPQCGERLFLDPLPIPFLNASTHSPSCFYALPFLLASWSSIHSEFLFANILSGLHCDVGFFYSRGFNCHHLSMHLVMGL